MSYMSAYLGVTQASKETGIHRRAIHRALTNGELPAHKLPGSRGPWIMRRADLNEWLARRHKQAS